jgi:hypothetical protein
VAEKRKSIWERMLSLDRRWIFLVEAIIVIVALVGPFSAGVKVTPAVSSFYDAIERSDPAEPILLSVDFPPSGLPELEPMIVGILRHAFERNQPVILMTLQMEGVAISERIVNQIERETNELRKEAGEARQISMGEDWVNLGFRAGFAAVILGLGDEIRSVFNTDMYGNYLDDLPMMQPVHNYADMALMIDISWSSAPEGWIAFAGAPFGITVLTGITAVSAPQYYVYLQTGQLGGMLGGLKGAAEYEALINRSGAASKGMVAQFGVHVFIVILILIGNVAFFALKGKRRDEHHPHLPDE